MPEIELRQQLTRRIYTDPDSVDWAQVMDRYGVEFVVVGGLEREVYGQDVDTRMARSLVPVFESGRTTIFSPRARVAATGPTG